MPTASTRVVRKNHASGAIADRGKAKYRPILPRSAKKTELPIPAQKVRRPAKQWPLYSVEFALAVAQRVGRPAPTPMPSPYNAAGAARWLSGPDQGGPPLTPPCIAWDLLDTENTLLMLEENGPTWPPAPLEAGRTRDSIQTSEQAFGTPRSHEALAVPPVGENTSQPHRQQPSPGLGTEPPPSVTPTAQKNAGVAATRCARSFSPDPQLLADVAAMRRSLKTTCPSTALKALRLEAALASWQGEGHKSIKSRLGVNHDTLWRTKKGLIDHGLAAYMALSKLYTRPFRKASH